MTACEESVIRPVNLRTLRPAHTTRNQVQYRDGKQATNGSKPHLSPFIANKTRHVQPLPRDWTFVKRQEAASYP